MKVILKEEKDTRVNNIKAGELKKKFRNYDQPRFPIYHNTQYSYSHKYIPKKHKLKDRREFINLMRFITDQVVHGILEEKDGVHLDGIGYFFVFTVPKPRTRMKDYRYAHVMYRDNFPCFMATGKNNPFSDFQFPYVTQLKTELRRRLRRGQLYTSNLSLMLDASQYVEIQRLEKRYEHKKQKN